MISSLRSDEGGVAAVENLCIIRALDRLEWLCYNQKNALQLRQECADKAYDDGSPKAAQSSRRDPAWKDYLLVAHLIATFL